MSRLLAAFAFATAVFAAVPATAQDDPPGRVGRLADARGGVSWYDAERGEWDDAERNRPLTSGDRVSTAPQGSAELRVGSTVLRLGGGTELQLKQVDDERLVFQLHRGSLALRVKTREKAEEIEVVTNEVRLTPQRAGHYRVDRTDDSTFAGVWRGDMRIEDAFGFTIATGQRAELWRERARRNNEAGELRHSWNSLPADEFADRVIAEDRRDEQRTASNTYVSPEMTGAEELDRFGRWDRHPEYGAVWYPIDVRVGWAPYRHGRWAWVRPWGWTWVDEAPWGFAPFHYGRWVFWNSRWGWAPGSYVARPVYAPALVAWIGGPRLSVSVQIGGPTVGWVPLAPREAFQPYYRHTPRYTDRINVGPMRPYPRQGQPHRPGGPPQQVPTGPIMYGNQGVPGAVTVVPRDALLQRQPVNRVAVGPDALRNIGNAPLGDGSPPPGQAYGPQRPAAAERPPERGPDRRQERDPPQQPPATMPMSAPERAMDRQAQPPQFPPAQPQPQAQTVPQPQMQPPPPMQPQRPVDRTQERNGEQRNQGWPRRGADPSAPDARRERVAPTAQPAPAAAAQPAPGQMQGPQRPPPQPAATPPPAPPTPAAPAPAAAPRPAPERAREGPRAQPPPDEDRKRSPGQRDGTRERENAR